jgi:ribosomal protein S18 acetylase RimI-like enzyme
METPSPEVRTATKAEADQCIGIIVLAFADDPAARWLYPDASQFLAFFPRFVAAFGGGAFAHGSAHLVAGSAAALWFPPGADPDEETLVGLIEQSAAPDLQDTVFAMLQEMGAYHPQEPHWYLPLIGTDPRQQGRGYGSALLRHALAACDEQKMPAYLEATSQRNLPLYQRHGFEPLGTIQIGASPPIVPMLRKPR